MQCTTCKAGIQRSGVEPDARRLPARLSSRWKRMTGKFTTSFWPSLPPKIIDSRFTRLTLALAISAMIVESLLPPRMLRPSVSSGINMGTLEDGAVGRLCESALTDAAGSTLPTLEGTEGAEHVKHRKLNGSLREAMQAAIYQVEREDVASPGDAPSTYHAFNPANNLDAYFTPKGTEIICRRNGTSSTGVARGEARLSMELRGYGYAQDMTALEPLTSDQIRVSNQRIENARTAAGTGERVLTEWYENKPDGLEQGFTITSKPKVATQGNWLNISLEVKGSLLAKQQKDGQAIFLETPKGERVLRYGGLMAEDSKGRELLAYMRVEGKKVSLVVDDKEAIYPLSVDPTFAFQQKLTASDGQAGDGLGISVSISGDTAVVGAYLATVGGNRFQGAAYVFVRNSGGWSQQQKLTATDGTAGDQFGESVSISGDTALVGASNATHFGPGAAYVFVRNGGAWSQQQKLTAADGQAFGTSVSINGDAALVGAPGVNSFHGAAYVFVRNSGAWSQQQKLTASDGQEFDEFGVSLSISGSTAIVGANAATVGANHAQGAAYVFVSNGAAWSQQQKLTADDGQAFDIFGSSVSIDGNTALIGAPQNEGSGRGIGQAYVFASDGAAWSQQQKLADPDGQSGDQFGCSVAISGDTAIVGAEGVTPGTVNQPGAAYVFLSSCGTWSQQQELTAPDGKSNERFGFSVSVSGGTALVGASNATVGPNAQQGASYVFARPCPTIVVGPSSLPSSLAGSAYPSTVFTETGGVGSVAFSECGTLPTGLSFNSGTATLSGTPTKPGTFPITVTATDQNACAGTQSYSIVITCEAITVTPDALPSGTAASPYGPIAFGQTGAIGAVTFTETGTLPTGLALSTSGVLSGTPTQTGIFPITVTATDSNNCTGGSACTLIINSVGCPTITVTPDSIPVGTLNAPYPVTDFGQTGGSGAATFMLTSGTLPAGMSLTAEGVLSGTPTQTVANQSLTITATASGCSGDVTVSLTIVGPPTITKAFGAPSILLGSTTILSFAIANPNTTATVTGVGFTDNLPSGLRVASPSGASGNVGGTITAVPGSRTITFAGGSVAPNASGNVTLNVVGVAVGINNNTTGPISSSNGGTGGASNTATITVVAPSNLAPRVFVSGGGNDSNPCNLGTPCRTIGAALNAVAPGGEVVILNSAGYGQFTINKAVTIIASQGVYAGVSVFSGDGITISAGPADIVILRGLTVNGLGGSSNGIVFNSAQALFIERCVINGFPANGLNFNGAGSLFAKDSIIRNNAGSGIRLTGSMSGLALASIDRVRLEANGTGLAVLDSARASIRKSVSSGNMTGLAVTPSTAPSEINVEKCLIANNGTGVLSQGSGAGVGTIRIAKCVITDNGLGLSQQSPGVLLSGGRNKLGGNTTDSTGTIGSYMVK
jgi:hypothetical protein